MFIISLLTMQTLSSSEIPKRELTPNSLKAPQVLREIQ